MTVAHFSVRLVAAAALVCASGASQAVAVVSTSLSTFTTATAGTGKTDTFGDQTINSYFGGGSPVLSAVRSAPTAGGAGSFGYTLTSSNLSTDALNFPSSLYVVPSAGFAGVSTTWYTDTLTFDTFTSPVYAFGAYFYGTNVLGELNSLGMTVTVTDTNNVVTTTTTAGGSLTNFVGFVSDTPLSSVVLSATAPNTNLFVSADNIVLSAVPEPGTWLLMLAGGAAALRLGARRRG